MKHKLTDREGFTLIELLAVTVVLILLGLILNAGFQMALKNYHDVTAVSEAQLLLSTAADAIADDLRYARDVDGGADPQYTSDSYGPGARFQVDPDGQLMNNNMKVLPEGAYRHNTYKIETCSITYADGIFTLKLKTQEAGGTIAAETELKIRCLNGGGTQP